MGKRSKNSRSNCSQHSSLHAPGDSDAADHRSLGSLVHRSGTDAVPCGDASRDLTKLECEQHVTDVSAQRLVAGISHPQYFVPKPKVSPIRSQGPVTREEFDGLAETVRGLLDVTGASAQRERTTLVDTVRACEDRILSAQNAFCSNLSRLQSNAESWQKDLEHSIANIKSNLKQMKSDLVAERLQIQRERMELKDAQNLFVFSIDEKLSVLQQKLSTVEELSETVEAHCHHLEERAKAQDGAFGNVLSAFTDLQRSVNSICSREERSDSNAAPSSVGELRCDLLPKPIPSCAVSTQIFEGAGETSTWSGFEALQRSLMQLSRTRPFDELIQASQRLARSRSSSLDNTERDRVFCVNKYPFGPRAGCASSSKDKLHASCCPGRVSLHGRGASAHVPDMHAQGVGAVSDDGVDVCASSVAASSHGCPQTFQCTRDISSSDFPNLASSCCRSSKSRSISAPRLRACMRSSSEPRALISLRKRFS